MGTSLSTDKTKGSDDIHDSLKFLKEALSTFYSRRNPEKLANVDKIIERFDSYGVADGAQRLNAALIQEYKSGLKVLSKTAVATRSHRSNTPGDLSFKEGETIEVVVSLGDVWTGRISEGRGVARRRGKFKSSYVKVTHDNILADTIAYDTEIRMAKLYNSMLELVLTEFKYVSDLKLVNEVFIIPISEKFGKKMSDQLFSSSWGNMLHIHEQILLFMQLSLPNYDFIVDTFGAPSGGNKQTTRRKSTSRTKRSSTTASDTRTMTSTSFSDTVAGGGGKPPMFRSHGNGATPALNMRTLGTLLNNLQSIHNEQRVAGEPSSPWLRGLRNKMLDRTAERLAVQIAKIAPFLRSSVPYIAAYSRSLETLEGLPKTRPSLSKLITDLETDERLNNLHLRDYLIKPVQRICKYPLLSKEVQSATVGSAKAAVDACTGRLLEAAEQVNDMVKQIEQINAARLVKYLGRIRPSEAIDRLGLRAPNIRLLRQGPMTLLSAPPLTDFITMQGQPNLTVFLFDTMLLITSMRKGGHLLAIKPSYHVVKAIRLVNAVHVSQSPSKMYGPTLTLALRSGDRTRGQGQQHTTQVVQWVFSLDNAAEADGWVADLKEAVSVSSLAAKHRRNKRAQQQQFSTYNQPRQVRENGLKAMHDRQLLMQKALQRQMGTKQTSNQGMTLQATRPNRSGSNMQSEDETTAELMRNLKDAMDERRMPGKILTPLQL